MKGEMGEDNPFCLQIMGGIDIFNKILKDFQFFSWLSKLRKRMLDVIL